MQSEEHQLLETICCFSNSLCKRVLRFVGLPTTAKVSHSLDDRTPFLTTGFRSSHLNSVLNFRFQLPSKSSWHDDVRWQRSQILLNRTHLKGIVRAAELTDGG
jgi:hypothetical protein